MFRTPAEALHCAGRWAPVIGLRMLAKVRGPSSRSGLAALATNNEGAYQIGYAPSRVPNASRLGTEDKEAGWSAPRGERRRVGVSSPSPAGGVIPAPSNVARPAGAECVTLHKLRPKSEGHPGKANRRHGGQRFEEEPS